MLQTKVTNSNRQEFYKAVYVMQSNSRDQLIDITKFNNTAILVDCCGAHYKNIFQKDVIVLETFRSAKEYKFAKNQFDKLINTNDNTIGWPSIDVLNPVLIFDRSPLLKYLSLADLSVVISTPAEKYQASKIIVRHKLTFVDDLRTTDRFYNFYNFKINNYCVECFSYNIAADEYYIQLKRILNIE